MPSSSVYTTVIERGNSPLSDWCLDYLKARIVVPWLDIGCNTGSLLAEVPCGTGIDVSPSLVHSAQQQGLNVHLCMGCDTPFKDRSFATVVLSSVLEQCEDPDAVFREAIRLGYRVIGLTPIPGAPWGTVGYNEFVKSVISREWLESRGCVVTDIQEKGKLYFEWTA